MIGFIERARRGEAREGSRPAVSSRVIGFVERAREGSRPAVSSRVIGFVERARDGLRSFC